MVEYTNIESQIMNVSKLAAVRGWDTVVDEMIPLPAKGLIVAILSSRPIGNSSVLKVAYGFYSTLLQSAVPEGSKAYEGFVKELPDLTSFEPTMVNFDVMTWLSLKDQRDECVAQYANTWKVPDTYKEVLTAIAQMHDENTGKIYKFFIDRL